MSPKEGVLNLGRVHNGQVVLTCIMFNYYFLPLLTLIRNLLHVKLPIKPSTNIVRFHVPKYRDSDSMVGSKWSYGNRIHIYSFKISSSFLVLY